MSCTLLVKYLGLGAGEGTERTQGATGEGGQVADFHALSNSRRMRGEGRDGVGGGGGGSGLQ